MRKLLKAKQYNYPIIDKKNTRKLIDGLKYGFCKKSLQMNLDLANTFSSHFGVPVVLQVPQSEKKSVQLVRDSSLRSDLISNPTFRKTPLKFPVIFGLNSQHTALYFAISVMS